MEMMEGRKVFAKWPSNQLFYAAKIDKVLDNHFVVCFSDGTIKKVRY